MAKGETGEVTWNQSAKGLEHQPIYWSGLELENSADVLKVLGKRKEHFSIVWVRVGRDQKGRLLRGCFSNQHTRFLVSRGTPASSLCPPPTKEHTFDSSSG